MLSFLHKYMALVFLLIGLALLIFAALGVAFEGAAVVSYFIIGIALVIGIVNYAHTGTPFTESSGGR